MALKNTETSYGSVSKIFHWTLFLLITGLLIVGLLMDDLPKPFKFQVYTVHKIVGLSVLLLMIMRIVWTSSNLKPLLPAHVKPWEKIVAHGVQHLFYLLLIIMPLAGWMMSTASDHIPHLFGIALPMPFVPLSKPLGKIAHSVHKYVGWALIVMITLHVMAGLKHHFIYKDNVLKRMLPGKE